MDDSSLPWGTRTLTPGEERSVTLGPLEIRLRAQSGEVWLSWERAEGGMGVTNAGSGDWQRWGLTDQSGNTLRIRPTLPDRPLVVSPDVSLNLAPRASARIYVRVPLVAAVEVEGPVPTRLLEVPTLVMSSTWWGTLHDGELAYWLTTRARRELTDEHFEPFLVMCPLDIRNRSSEVLEVTKFLVRVAHLSIFSHAGRLWADQTRVTYRGDEDGSEIEITGQAPEEASGGTILAPPRAPLPKGFRSRTFAALKAISGF